jgi:ribosome-associated toxin RatA of RatAB toxin-antitoxin module
MAAYHSITVGHSMVGMRGDAPFGIHARMLCLLLTFLASADPLDDLLEKGLVSSVEMTDDGRVAKTTSMVRVHASPERVWEVLKGFDQYVEWVPRMAHSSVTKSDGNTHHVTFGVTVPGPNIRFGVAYTIDEPNRTLKAAVNSGAVRNGTWDFKVMAEGDYTLVYRTGYASMMIDAWIINQFDDDSYTLELALNAGAPLVELIGLKREAERRETEAASASVP